MIQSLKIGLQALSVLFIIAVGASNFAGAAKPISLSPEQTKSINKISAYMNSFVTLQGEFTQISPKGNISKGVMFISKPGKLRFEYSPPNPFPSRLRRQVGNPQKSCQGKRRSISAFSHAFAIGRFAKD